MAKLKLIYKKLGLPPHIYSTIITINDMAVPKKLYDNGIKIVKLKEIGFHQFVLIMKSKDKKNVLKHKVLDILTEHFSGEIEIILLK